VYVGNAVDGVLVDGIGDGLLVDAVVDGVEVDGTKVGLTLGEVVPDDIVTLRIRLLPSAM